MEIIETPVFTKQIDKLLSTEDYRAFQLALSLNPESGDLSPEQLKLLSDLVRQYLGET